MQKHIKLTFKKINTLGAISECLHNDEFSLVIKLIAVLFNTLLYLEEMDIYTSSNIFSRFEHILFSIATFILEIVLSFLLQTLSFRSPHTKKFTDVKSGKLGGYSTLLLPNHLLCIFLSR